MLLIFIYSSSFSCYVFKFQHACSQNDTLHVPKPFLSLKSSKIQVKYGKMAKFSLYRLGCFVKGVLHVKENIKKNHISLKTSDRLLWKRKSNIIETKEKNILKKTTYMQKFVYSFMTYFSSDFRRPYLTHKSSKRNDFFLKWSKLIWLSNLTSLDQKV